MSHDLMFRLILAVLAVALYVNHHVIHRRPSVRRPKSAQGKNTLERWLVITALCWTFALAFYAAGVPGLDLAVPLPLWLRWVGVAAMAACAPLSQWTYHSLGVHFSKKLELNDGHRLIRSGPYRFVRHPMYATLFLCAIATCLISANVFVMVSVVVVAIVFLLRMGKEEAMLVERFGDEYREYRQRTWALVPKFGILL